MPQTSISLRLPRLAVLAVALLVFLPVVKFEFNGWDDGMVLADNPRLLAPTLSNLAFYWQHAEYDLYVPVTQTVWWLTAKVARINGANGQTELNPAIFHLLNLAIHLIAAAACFELLRKLLCSIWPAAIGAMVFAIHPLQVETVALTAATKDLLAGMFSIAALAICVERVVQRRSADSADDPIVGQLHRRYWLATLVAIAAMLSKPSAVVLPAMLWIVDFLMQRRPMRFSAMRAGFWLAIAIPIAIVAKYVQAGHDVSTVPAPHRLLVAGDALAFYLWKLIWPMNLGFDYGRTPGVVLGWSQTPFVACVPLAVAVLAWILWKRARFVAVGLLIFAVALLPVLGLFRFDFQIYSTVGDHYVYLAMLGVGLIVAALAKRPAGSAVAIAAIPLLSIISGMQVHTWRDLESSSRQALRVNPTSWASYNNLSSALMKKNRIDEAIEAARSAVALRPELTVPRAALCGALTLRADTLAAAGDAPAAIATYREAIAVFATSAGAWTNLAATLAETGALDEAIAAYEQALKIDPKSPTALSGLEMAKAARRRQSQK